MKSKEGLQYDYRQEVLDNLPKVGLVKKMKK